MSKENVFNSAADSIVHLLTAFINAYSGLLQLTVYFVYPCPQLVCVGNCFFFNYDFGWRQNHFYHAAL